MSYLSSREYSLDKAIEQLWNWVGEQRKKEANFANTFRIGNMAIDADAKRSAYSNVRLYMRKFFSGLIDFED